MTCPICLVEHLVAVPCVHLNGTSAGELLEQLENAVEAVRALTVALNRAAPNGRDYYVYSPNQTQRAIKEHCLRQEKVLEVAAELVMMRDHVQECINLKNESKRR